MREDSSAVRGRAESRHAQAAVETVAPAAAVLWRWRGQSKRACERVWLQRIRGSLMSIGRPLRSTRRRFDFPAPQATPENGRQKRELLIYFRHLL